ncbi:ABC transporter permease [Frigidibacter sp. RF13]|uniref:ABC transporter permease n=1 Tax=Frigidibacter sp. RF13 TaxID=2997340 RepID=UPI0022718F75|nr:ABC transporter permease [Frigidibacter sp. RF13]MCY1128395.1 ABC transporter permease [Frigidibacter sp. RF13]
MFSQGRRPRSSFEATLETFDLIYHCTVRSLRGNGSNALLSLASNFSQTMVMILALYTTMTLMGYGSNSMRGDFLVFLITGVMSYVTYKKTMTSVFGSEGATSPMMLHAPMNPAIALAAACVSSLYLQVVTATVILFGYHCAFKPVEIDDPAFVFTMLLLAWLFGIGTGLVLRAIKPWAPKLAPTLLMIVQRVNIFASGKMVVGNSLGFGYLYLFNWNPLFHIIDQMRGAVFINYIPRNSSVEYALIVSLALIVLGMMGDFFTRQRVSLHWYAR